MTRIGALDMQVCIPSEWTDDMVEAFAERQNPSGTTGWHIRRQGDRMLGGHDERVACEQRPDFVHIMLDP